MKIRFSIYMLKMKCWKLVFSERMKRKIFVRYAFQHNLVIFMYFEQLSFVQEPMILKNVFQFRKELYNVLLTLLC